MHFQRIIDHLLLPSFQVFSSMSIQIGESPRADGSPRGIALFALGFRPFFLAAGLSAVVLLSI